MESGKRLAQFGNRRRGKNNDPVRMTIVVSGRFSLYDLIEANAGFASSQHRRLDRVKFRLKSEQQRFFVDLSAQFGYKKFDYFYSTTLDAQVPANKFDESFFLVLAQSCLNCTVYDGWYAGVGAEPAILR